MNNDNKKTYALIALAPVVVALVLGAWWMTSQRGASPEETRLRLEEATGAIEKLGMTVDAEELGVQLSMPSSENGAAVFATLGYKFKFEGEIPALWAVPEDAVDNCAQYHAQNPGVYAQLLLASSKAGFDFERQWELGPAMLLPELSQAKGMVRYCANLAKADADVGDYDSALEKLLVADRIGWHIGSEPNVISKLVENACRSIVLNTATIIFIDHRESEDALAFAVKLGRLLKQMNDVRTCLQGQVNMGVVSINEFTPEEIMQLGGGYSVRSGSGANISRETREVGTAVFLERIKQLYEIWSQIGPASDVLQMTDAFEDQVENDTQPGADYTVILLPILSNVYRSSTVIAMMTSMFKTLGKILPELRERGSEFDVDDHTQRYGDGIRGTELLVTLDDDGLKLYSRGWDGHDDGGPAWTGYRSFNPRSDDFGFWIPLVKE